MEPFVWWGNQSAVEEVSENEALLGTLPDYFVSEIEDCYGRNGRGRLWVHESLDSPQDMNLTGSESLYKATSDCAGIVFREEDLQVVSTLPGFITDFKLNKVE